MNVLNRREGETDYEYCFRLSYAKVREGLDIDWQEIVNLCNLNWSADHCRKTMIGAIRHQDYIDSKTKEQLESEQYEKLIQKELELKKEKVKVQDLKTQVNKQIRELARKENLGEILEEKLDKLPNQMINMNYINHTPSKKQGIAMISDVHYGMVVDNFLNKYNPDIAKERMDYLTNKIIEYSKLNNLDVMNVCLLGDMISGEQYLSVRLENRENLINQIINVSELLSEAIYKIALNVPFVTISIADGNHERVYNKKENLNKDNYTELIRKFLELKLKDISNITFTENIYDNNIISFECCGNTVVGLHGDKCKKDKVSYEMYNMLNKKIDIILMGHFHQISQDICYETIVYRNGSFIGTDEYARNLNLNTYPTQKLLVVSELGVECCYDIRLR